jgi:hypothetical protein
MGENELPAVVRRARRIMRELHMLRYELGEWDRDRPPVQHLMERLESVEGDLLKLEAELRALRPRAAG